MLLNLVWIGREVKKTHQFSMTFIKNQTARFQKNGRSFFLLSLLTGNRFPVQFLLISAVFPIPFRFVFTALFASFCFFEMLWFSKVLYFQWV